MTASTALKRTTEAECVVSAALQQVETHAATKHAAIKNEANLRNELDGMGRMLRLYTNVVGLLKKHG
jgi:hypothetical protein